MIGLMDMEPDLNGGEYYWCLMIHIDDLEERKKQSNWVSHHANREELYRKVLKIVEDVWLCAERRDTGSRRRSGEHIYAPAPVSRVCATRVTSTWPCHSAGRRCSFHDSFPCSGKTLIVKRMPLSNKSR